jgi:hypothetical protein
MEGTTLLGRCSISLCGANQYGADGCYGHEVELRLFALARDVIGPAGSHIGREISHFMPLHNAR